MANGSMEADSFGEGICLILACGCWRSVHAALQMPYGPPVLTEVLLILGFDLTNEMEDHLVIQIPSTSEGVPSYRFPSRSVLVSMDISKVPSPGLKTKTFLLTPTFLPTLQTAAAAAGSVRWNTRKPGRF